MTSGYIASSLRIQLNQVDGQLCSYCHTAVENIGQRLTIDHIFPRAKGGATSFDNLCLACRVYNEYKSDQIRGLDPLYGEQVALFNPREDEWKIHFQWDESGTRLIGLTAKGRATIVALQMNNEVIVRSRSRWTRVGWHPPTVDLQNR